MTNIKNNLSEILSTIPANVKLIAVSKFHPIETILNAFQVGQKIFGENKVQELVSKQALLPKEIEWHLIGHLQTNKVKYIAPFVHLIHGIDSLSLLQTINKEGLKNNRIISCLLQLYIAEEETKFGLSFDEAKNILESIKNSPLQNIRIAGLMGMATYTDDKDQVRKEFRFLADCFRKFKNEFFIDNPEFKELSMGMSDDYQIAIEEGSTMVRIGTAIFGKREY